MSKQLLLLFWIHSDRLYSRNYKNCFVMKKHEISRNSELTQFFEFWELSPRRITRNSYWFCLIFRFERNKWGCESCCNPINPLRTVGSSYQDLWQIIAGTESWFTKNIFILPLNLIRLSFDWSYYETIRYTAYVNEEYETHRSAKCTRY